MSIISCILRKNYDELKKILSEKKENINELRAGGDTFLMYAIANDFIDGAKLLIDSGIDVCILDKNLDSALSVAASQNSYVIAKIIIQKCPSLVNIADSYGNPPLWHAIVSALKEIDVDYSMIDLLLENGADLYYENKKGQTCLYLINRRERFEIIDHIKAKYPQKLR